MNITFKSAADLAGLPPLRLRWVCLELLPQKRIPAPDSQLTAGEALLIWVTELVYRLAISGEQKQLVLKSIKRPCLIAGECAEDYLAGRPTEVFQVVFVDGRFLAYTCADGWLDLTDGSEHEELPQIGIESTAYNLLELFRRQYLKTQGCADVEPPDQSTTSVVRS